MEFLGLETEKMDKTNLLGLNIDMSPFLNKLNMLVSLQELLKIPSINRGLRNVWEYNPK